MMVAYNIIASLLLWCIVIPWHALLIALKRFSPAQLDERLGRVRVPQRERGYRLLVHAVSVGEVAAAEPVLRELVAAGSDIEIILTAGNKDGISAVQRLRSRYPEISLVQLLPWDARHLVAPWLRAVSPDLAVLVETELWPNLISECGRADIPLFVVNGRMYPRDVRRYALLAPFFRRLFAAFSCIGVQSTREREHFLAAGAPPGKIRVIGNSKYDGADPPPPAPRELHHRLHHLPLVVVGGSTHAPEESWLLEAFQHLRRSFPEVRLILAPRHTARAGRIGDLVRHKGFLTGRWSTLSDSDRWDVLILDEVGLLREVYRYAQVAVLGGSFVKYGGHNFLEAVIGGCAVVVGPHMHHFDSIASEFIGGGALLSLASHHELSPVLLRLLTDPAERTQINQRAASLLQAKRGCAREYAEMLRHHLRPHGHATTTAPAKH